MRISLRNLLVAIALFAVALALGRLALQAAMTVKGDSGDSACDDIEYAMAVLPYTMSSATFLVGMVVCLARGHRAASRKHSKDGLIQPRTVATAEL